MKAYENDEELVQFIRDWKPQPGMSQDLPGMPPSRISPSPRLSSDLRRLVAEGRIEYVELRGKQFIRATGA